MKTRIYNSYADFLDRENKDENGVSKSFAENNPNWEVDNEDNKACWNCSGCYDCSDCFRCSECSRCLWKEDLENKNDEKGESDSFKVPVIENIHQKVLEAVSEPKALNMSDWHTCDTRHCRAGWVVHLSGPEGYELEKKTSTKFAASQIYKASSSIKVSPVRFYEDNHTALEDIKRCAKEEAEVK